MIYKVEPILVTNHTIYPRRIAPKKRHIDSPNEELKSIQRKINTKILKPMVDRLPDYMHGSRTAKGIKTNAAMHIGKEMLLSLDIKNCFPNITRKRVYYTLRNNGCSKSVAKILANLTTKDGVLPQGCPTSASICNLVLAPLVIRMHDSNNKKGIVTSQYIDDLFFSGNKKAIMSIVRPMLTNIWHFGLKHNPKKVRLQPNSSTMRAAGIIVNKKSSAGRKRIRIIEREIAKIAKRDVVEYYAILEKRKLQSQSKTKQRIKGCRIEKLFGEVSNVISINQEQGSKLKRKLEKRIASLS